MGNRNSGGGGQGQQSKKECKAIGRSRRGGRTPYTQLTNLANKRRHLQAEQRKAEKKLAKLKRRGDIQPRSIRERKLTAHISRIKIAIIKN